MKNRVEGYELAPLENDVKSENDAIQGISRQEFDRDKGVFFDSKAQDHQVSTTK